MSERLIQNDTLYQDRLIKLIPSDFVAAYLAIHGLISNISEGQQFYILLIAAIFLLLLLPLYQFKALGVTSFTQNIACMISLAIWIVSIGGILEVYNWYNPIYSAISVILWTLISPVLVSGK